MYIVHTSTVEFLLSLSRKSNKLLELDLNMNLAKESRPSKTETTYNDQPLVRQGRRNWLNLIPGTTLQYMMNVKLSKQRF